MNRNRQILALSVPAAATLVADPLLGIVDTAVVGRIGSAELGAMGLAVGVLASVSWIFNFLAYGTTATVSRAMGAGDLDLAGRRVAHAIQMAIAIGVVVGALLLVFADVVIGWTGAVGALRDPASEYLRIRAVGIPFLLLSYVGHGAFRGVSNTRAPMAFVVAANVVNASLDVVLVLVLDMGLAGAAWATVAAEALVVALFVMRGRGLDLVLSGHGRPTRPDLRSVFSVGRDLVIRTGALLAVLLAASIVAARIGADTAAAHQVIFAVWIFVSSLLDGLAIAAQALIGTALGRGDRDEALRLGALIMRWAFLSGAVVAIVLLPLGTVIPRVLTDEPSVIAVVGGAWWLASACYAFSGGAFVLDGVLMGASDFGWLRTWAVAAAIAAIGALVVVGVAGGGLLALWFAFEAMVVVRVAANVVRVSGGDWAVVGASR